VRQRPPLPTPAPLAPRVDASAPAAPGNGKLVVDVVDGPTPIHRVHMKSEPVTTGSGETSYRFYEAPEILCSASPCIAEVRQGNLLLGFPVVGKGSLDVELVHVGAEPGVYRRSLSHWDGGNRGMYVLGIVGTSVGAASLITGIALLPVGLSDDNDAMTTAGAITMGAGAVLTTIGILMIRGGAPIYTPGSSNHYPLP
jgi:hypothetical protein